MRFKGKKQIIPLPFLYYYIPVLFFAAAGFFDSIYLAVSHYRVHADLTYSSFCAVSRALNCDTVSSSPYAVFLGIPVAVWGALGYAAAAFLLVTAFGRSSGRKTLWPLIFWVSFLYCALSLVLAAISTILINSYCIMCIVSYLVNFALLYYAWFINKRFGAYGLVKGLPAGLKTLWSLRKASIPAAAGFLIIVFGLGAAMPEYWHMEPPKLPKSLPRGITEDGHPWIGAEDPELVIHEFTDYLCTQCRIKHFYLRRLIAENSDKIRLVHRHFPMDHKFNPLVKEPYHMGSGALAVFSIYAQEQGRFWEANDRFFQMNRSTGAINTKTIAGRLGLDPAGLARAMRDRSTLYHLQKDIEKGLKLGFTGTPGYVINGEVFQGRIPPRVLKKILEN